MSSVNDNPVMISIKGLKKSYGDLHVLKGIESCEKIIWRP